MTATRPKCCLPARLRDAGALLAPVTSPMQPEPAGDCSLCPRLAAFRDANRAAEPSWHNRPVPAFGALTAPLLVVGLAPGLRGANRTGRPFTGDYAGDLLYPTLIEFGFASGEFAARPDDGLVLLGCRITNAVRCVPPQNRPEAAEVNACRQFLVAEIAAMPRLQAILCLGGLSHGAVLTALALRRNAYPFRHGACYPVPRGDGGTLLLADSYHCSRYNTNTGRLTVEMFRAVVAALRHRLEGASR